MQRAARVLACTCLGSLFLAACTTVVPTGGQSDRDGPPAGAVDVSAIPDAVPRSEPRSRYGNPPSYEVDGHRYIVMQSSLDYAETGIASWYGTKFHGRRTSSGETYDMYGMTAAHRSLPLPTYVEVTNMDNGRRVVVKVNDRGPFHENRIIDLSYSAALKLGFAANGTALVEVRAINPDAPQPSEPRIAANLKAGNVFFIQVGAFGNYENAAQLRSRLAGLADSLIQINEAVVKEKKLYRVRFGPIDDVNLADRIVQDLARYGVMEHQLVVDL